MSYDDDEDYEDEGDEEVIPKPKKRGRAKPKPEEEEDDDDFDDLGPIRPKKRKTVLKTDGPLYCSCQEPWNPRRPMIGCDSCDEWYHMTCVGIKKQDAEALPTWECPGCQQARAEGRVPVKKIHPPDPNEQGAIITGVGGAAPAPEAPAAPVDESQQLQHQQQQYYQQQMAGQARPVHQQMGAGVPMQQYPGQIRPPGVQYPGQFMYNPMLPGQQRPGMPMQLPGMAGLPMHMAAGRGVAPGAMPVGAVGGAPVQIRQFTPEQVAKLRSTIARPGPGVPGAPGVPMPQQFYGAPGAPGAPGFPSPAAPAPGQDGSQAPAPAEAPAPAGDSAPAPAPAPAPEPAPAPAEPAPAPAEAAPAEAAPPS